MRDALADLEKKGLVSRAPGRALRFVPAPPEVAVEALAHRRMEEIERARLEASRLGEEFRQAVQRARPAEVVEVVVGREAVVQRFEQLQRSARHEMLIFDKPPYARPQLNEIELELLGRGVRYRAVYEQEAFAFPGVLEWLEELTAAGEQARVMQGVPIKLDIADDKLALIPLYTDEPGLEGGLLVYPSPLLEALKMLFEVLWERAVPVRELDRRQHVSAPSPEDEKLLTLLAAGFKDEVIARQLGVGLRTARRRVSRLMDALGAQTRYQAGLQAAKKGWS